MKIFGYDGESIFNFNKLKEGDVVYGSEFYMKGLRLVRHLKPCKLTFVDKKQLVLNFIDENGNKVQQNLRYNGDTATNGISLFTTMEEAVEHYEKSIQDEIANIDSMKERIEKIQKNINEKI